MEDYERLTDRRHRIQRILYEITFYLEFILSIMVITLVVFEIIKTGLDLIASVPHLSDDIHYHELLKRAMDIIIGVEFIKMLCRHNLDSVIEVLMFAMARHLIVYESSMVDGLICIVAISILFVVRKYLFVPKIDSMEALESHDTGSHKHNPHDEQKKTSDPQDSHDA